ncbi:MAG: membrane protein insertase YidC [Acidobacteriia bacterium]|nr:membrane protein insertase YidC [Terriglobia bacterium]
MMLAFVMVFGLIIALQYFLPKPQAPKSQPAGPQQSQQQPTGSPAAAASSATPAASATQATAATAGAPKAPVKMAEAETESVLENDFYRITFTNRGAMVKSWELIETHKDRGGKPVAGNYKYKGEKDKPINLVNAVAAQQLGLPLSFFSYDKELEKKLNQAMFQASVTGRVDAHEPLVFEFSDGDVVARKVFRTDGGYAVSIETEVLNRGQRVQAFPQWPGGLGDQVTPASFGAAGFIDWRKDGAIERKAATSGFSLIGSKKWVVGGDTINGPFEWAATVDQYFAAVFMPDSAKDTVIITLNNPIEIPKNPASPGEGKDKVSVLGLAFGNVTGLTRTRLYVGPKELDALESTQAQIGGADLRGIMDFGMFGFIARPLFLWLRWTHEHWVPNWGWAIAFLTVVITMVLLPLRISGMKSQLKMQKIQPQMKSIQEKYKRYSMTDPRRADMQKEMSELYKREGVNPIGGCFPMLLQMPFLIAFYSMLGNATELRQAGWLWITDLSAPDPIHLLPIIIVITMFLTQKTMPQAGMDPAQQKILNVMGPLMLGYISWFLASGLCVYWAISNLLGYVQQTLINRSELGQQVRKGMERRATRKR